MVQQHVFSVFALKMFFSLSEFQVQKFGDPNGIVRFEAAVGSRQVFEEPVSGSRLVSFPMYRSQGTIGDIQVTDSDPSLPWESQQDL